MKTITFKLLPILLLSLIVLSCKKKYEEGPLISFRSAKERIMGTWKVDSFTANGADSMNYINRYYLNGTWRFYIYGSDYPAIKVAYDTIYYLNVGAGWELTDNNKKLRISPRDLYSTKSGYNKSMNNVKDWLFYNTKWDIIRLKQDDLKLRLNKDNVEYVLHFKPN